MASHQLAKFCGHKCSGSRNIIVLGCHVISQDHVIKESSNSMGRSLSK